MTEQTALLNAERARIEAAYAASRHTFVHKGHSLMGGSWAGLAALPEATALPRYEIGVQNFHLNVARGLEPSKMGCPT